MNTKKMRGWLWVVALAGIATAGYLYYQYNRKAADAADRKPEHDLPATVLLQAFTTNEADANRLYLGRLVQVNGLLRSMERDGAGSTTLILGDSSSMSSIRCTLAAGKAKKQEAPSQGSRVTVKGFCTGYRADDMGLGADVLLNRCIIIN